MILSLGAHRLRCLFHLSLGPQILQIDTLGILNIVDDLTLATCLATEVLYVQLPFAEASYVITTIQFLLFMGFQTNSHLENEERKDSSQIQTDIRTILHTVYILDCLQSQPLTAVYTPSHQEASLFSFPLESGLLCFQGLGSCHFCFLGALGRRVRTFVQTFLTETEHRKRPTEEDM